MTDTSRGDLAVAIPSIIFLGTLNLILAIGLWNYNANWLYFLLVLLWPPGWLSIICLTLIVRVITNKGE